MSDTATGIAKIILMREIPEEGGEEISSLPYGARVPADSVMDQPFYVMDDPGFNEMPESPQSVALRENRANRAEARHQRGNALNDASRIADAIIRRAKLGRKEE